MLTFNEYEDMVEKEFIKRRLKQERTYKRIVLFEKYMPLNIHSNLQIYVDNENVWLEENIKNAMFKTLTIPSKILNDQ